MCEAMRSIAKRSSDRTRNIQPTKTITFTETYDIMRTFEYSRINQAVARCCPRRILTMISNVAIANTTAMGRLTNPKGFPPDAVNA